MRPFALCSLAVGISLLAFGPSGATTPVAQLRWNSCAGPVNKGPGDGPAQSLFLSESGLSSPVRGFDAQLVFWSPGSGLPDAWRFDTRGCSAVGWNMVLASTSKSCPVIRGGSPLVSAIFRYATSGVTGRGTIDFAELFPANANPPAGTGLIVEFDFDHSASTLGPGSTATTCGCYDRPLCIALGTSDYLDADMNPQSLLAGQGYVTWNDPSGTATYCPTGPDLCSPEPCFTDSTCVAVTPAHAASWGSIKGMYRSSAH